MPMFCNTIRRTRSALLNAVYSFTQSWSRKTNVRSRHMPSLSIDSFEIPAPFPEPRQDGRTDLHPTRQLPQGYVAHLQPILQMAP